MAKKFKIPKNPDCEEIKNVVETLYYYNKKTIELNHIRKLIAILGGEEIQGKGSSVRFSHPYLETNPFFMKGIFQIHKIHKGGNKEEIRLRDFRHYLYDILNDIIENYYCK